MNSKQSLYLMCALGAFALAACSNKGGDKSSAEPKAVAVKADDTASGVPADKVAESEEPRAPTPAPTTATAKPSADPPPPPRRATKRAKGKAGITGGDFGAGGSAGSLGEGKAGKSDSKRAGGRYAMKKPGGAIKLSPKGGPLGDKYAAEPRAKDRVERKPKKVRRPPRPRHRPGQLTAGEWRDLDNWGFWRALFVDSGQTRSKWKSVEKQWGYNTSGRISVVVTADGKPVVDADVVLHGGQGNPIWNARTDNRGTAELFAGLFSKQRGPFKVVASAGGRTISQSNVSINADARPVELALGSRPAISNNVDIMFVVDTTGSMGDELGYLKSELRNVIGRVKDNRGRKLNVRTSVNFYRDRGDEYLVRPFKFTTDLDRVLSNLGAQSANGGGDFPEAVDAALADAVYKHEWSRTARTRIMFLLLDAPPHPGSKVMKSLHRATIAAAAKGIRIIPVSGSGINKPTEFLMRFLAVSTGGTYVFLTDDSGIGGSHIKPTIGPHEVKLLNKLLTEIINRYVAA